MDADLLQPGWRETMREVNGVSLHVVEAGRQGDPLLVLLHGFPEFWWGWRHQIGPLADAGFHVVVPDMRGYNLSAKPKGVAAYAIDTLAADVVALAASFGVERFRLVGHDWGGAVAWATAARYPDRVERLMVLCGPHPDVMAGQMRRHPSQARKSWYIFFVQIPVLSEAILSAFGHAMIRRAMTGSAKPGAFAAADLDRYVEAWRRPGALTAMLSYYRAMRHAVGKRGKARIAPPTLVLWGRDDAFLEPHVAEASVAQCEDGRLEVIDGASHWLQAERPEYVARSIAAFMAKE